jgi:hypothetical protein
LLGKALWLLIAHPPAAPAVAGQQFEDTMKIAVIAVAVVLAIFRPFLEPHPVSLQGSYEALAHLFVGGVFGGWMVNRSRWLLVTGLGITAVEILSAIASAFRG